MNFGVGPVLILKLFSILVIFRVGPVKRNTLYMVCPVKRNYIVVKMEASPMQVRTDQKKFNQGLLSTLLKADYCNAYMPQCICCQHCIPQQGWGGESRGG